MKKQILQYTVALLGLLMLQSCANSKSADLNIPGRYITGNIKNANGKDAVLFVFEGGEQSPIDTVKIEEDKFVLETKTKDLRLYFLIIDPTDKSSLPVYIISNENDDNITLTGEMPKFGENVVITGSDESRHVKDYQDFSMTLFPQKQALFTQLQSVDPKDSVAINAVRAELDALMATSRDYAIEYIDKNPGSMAGWLMLREFYPVTGVQDFNMDYLDYFKKVSNGIADKYPNSEYPALINQDVTNLENQIKMANAKEEMSEGGQNEAPDISLKSPNGEEIKLSSLRGQVVLIDFWASWCGPCRKENPNVVANYNKFKDKGFTIYSVSLDKDKGAWEKAIKADNLSWPYHVSDLKGWSSSAAALYNVRSIPASFLIDENGVIIATNLRGPALGQKLTEILGK